MGPLVPYIISNEFNLIIALLIGIGFGFILEQAGFSSTKKLVGLFYGYDFTVLRVFFTAGVTAMVGVLLFQHYGLIDLNLIYINPTFLRSAIVGGLVMGAGFIIGGFCPGTSVCAASIGKMDAMLFVLGSIIGVFIFAETYPLISDFYLADNMGAPTMYQMLGISMPLFAFLLTAVAIFAFIATWQIEKKVRKVNEKTSPKWISRYAFASAIPFVIVAVVSFLPGKQEIIENRIAEAKRQQKCVFHEIDPDRLADEIVHHYYQLNVIDVRTPEEFEAFHLPMAINIPLSEITDRKWEDLFKQKIKTNVFYADGDTIVRMACLKANFVGDSKNKILNVSALDFKQMFFDITPPDFEVASKKEINEYNFRSEAAINMLQLTEALKNIGKPVTKTIVPAAGGCS
ncbi:MAG TPA: YeeE/YedE thiosulfate transporter family protein [Prolixibacteraceae bacterium]|nr:YeeE/YedE thiosulfate transporter family protein [Prolixibacteraceae bacterium]HPR61605.1 YeeE/YedE thiosulfate transporter family protein [Prolixibacteraceae bacterium]